MAWQSACQSSSTTTGPCWSFVIFSTQWNVIFAGLLATRLLRRNWPRLTLLLMTFMATLRLLSSPQCTASSLSTSMTLLKASVTLVMPCAFGSSNIAMTTLSADSPAFSARKSSGHKYATEGHGSLKQSTARVPPVVPSTCSTPPIAPLVLASSGRLLGSEVAVKADERERDVTLSVHGRNDPPQAVPCFSKQVPARRLPCGSPPLEPLRTSFNLTFCHLLSYHPCHLMINPY